MGKPSKVFKSRVCHTRECAILEYWKLDKHVDYTELLDNLDMTGEIIQLHNEISQPPSLP